MTSQVNVAGAYPGGTVTFYDGNMPLPGTVQITHGETGQIYADIYNISFSTPGTHTITAQYSGDNNYAASTSSPVTITVLISTSIALSESATNINYGQSVTVTAVMTSTSNGPAITGQIFLQGSWPNFTNVTSSPGTDSNGNQMLTVMATLTPPGLDTIYAIYQGDANYAYSTSSYQTINVNIPDFTLAPASGLSVVPVAGQPGSGQITITPVSSNQLPSTVTLTFAGGYGQNTISGYTIAIIPQQVSLNGSPTTATFSMTPTITIPAQAVRSRARHAGFLKVKRANWWMLSLAAGVGALFLLGLPGRRRRFRKALGLSAVCLFFLAIGCSGGSGGSGGGGGGGGGSGETPQPTTIALTTSNAKVPQGGSFILTATVSGGNSPTGAVSFYDYSTGIPIGAAGLINGQAQVTPNLSGTIGVYQITATYSGDTNNLTSTSAPVTQVITGTFPIFFTANTGTDSHTIQGTVGLQ